MALSERARTTALVVFATAFSFVLFRGTSGGGAASSGGRAPEEAVPAGAFLTASLDADALRASGILGGLTAERPRAMLGVTAVAEACGFDPLARVRRAALAVPEEDSGRGDFGLAAKVEVTGEELRGCAKKLAERRGAATTTREVGAFTVLDAPAPPSAAPPGGPRRTGAPPSLAYGKGLLLVGQGAWLERMIGAAEGRVPAIASDAAHGALRATLGHGEGWQRPMLLVTMVLPRSLRERLRGEMAAEVGAADPSAAAMGGVLGVAAAGLALRHVAPPRPASAGSADGHVEARAELVCDDEAACAAVEKLLLKKRLDWSREVTLRLLGLGQVLDTFEVDRSGPRVHVRAHADAATLAAVLERLLRLGSAR